MKSLGMITACFPHVDEETRNILQSAMDKAKDMGDFAEILCDVVCSEEVNELTIFVAYSFASNASNHHIIHRLEDAGKHSALSDIIVSRILSEERFDVTWSDVQQSVSRAIEAAPNDWFACGVYLSWRLGVESNLGFPESATDFKGLDVLEEKIEEDEEFSFYLSGLYRLRANRLTRERRIDEAIKLYDLAIKHAEEHENYDDLMMCLFMKANLIKRVDVDEALNTLEKLRSISEEIGMNSGLYNYNQEMGHIAMARGEFNLSVQYHVKQFEISEELGRPRYMRGPKIAFLYNMMGDGAKALELMTNDGHESLSDDPYVLIQEAWALTNLGNVNDAEPVIMKAKEIILKSSNEVRLGLVYMVEGLIEKAQRDYGAASFTLERALEIFERYMSLAFVNVSLVNLCDIEIETFDYEDKKTDLSGPWMARLIEHVEKNDLPAIEGHLKLLKAKFLYKQAQFKQSEKLLTEVRMISKSQSMEYLDDVAKVLIPESRK